MEGADATADGAPGELTFRRYRRYAQGGFGLIWIEATAVAAQGRSNPRQLWLNTRNVAEFARLIAEIKQAARQARGHDVAVVLQLAHARHDPLISDSDLDRLQKDYAAASRLAEEAGIDGVDIKACHGDLAAACLAARARPGRYGGSFENRSRFLRETVMRCRTALSHAFLASRMAAGDGGADLTNEADPEALALACALQEDGVSLLNVSVQKARDGGGEGGRHPIEDLARRIAITRAIQKAIPAIPVVGGGYSWLRHFVPPVAAGVVREGGAALIGLGRAALAYPDLAGDLLRAARVDPDRCCLDCSACSQMLKDGGTAGCVIMDSGTYGEEYRQRRHFALDHLRQEAERCRGCVPAPCRQGCPTRIEVPAFMEAFARDDVAAAYGIIRKANVLPEMCAHLCLPNAMCEGPCLLNTLERNPIPIHDIQYAVCWLARQRGLTGVRLPARESGKRTAIVGAGPAGVACAVTLLEAGHQVVLFERAGSLGGTPERLIRPSRFSGAREEMEAILKPALREGRLTLKFGMELGAGLSLKELTTAHDAVFLAPGVWGERSLGSATGVVNGIAFLQKTRSGEIKDLPPRVVLLAGGDSAVDSAMVARELGVLDLTVVYEGSLAEMNWHLPDSWFRTAGVNFMTLTRPLDYRVEPDGKVSGVRVCVKGGGGPAEGQAMVLAADLVIESLGLGVELSLAQALQGAARVDDGLIKTAQNQSFSCGAAGLFAGGGAINGGASVVQCVAEGMKAGREIDAYLRR
jgi:NADPH-dependent glutamate synthase beta subunit-like oxidoreductase/2,4-dienoyl-CoA reductase-like NADH-dependent reductase (Old Yellow Enzyme family)